MDEFALIEQYFTRPGHAPGRGVLLGPGDDGALLVPPADGPLVMTLDTSLAGRHFPADLPPADIGFRCLAVNLSDLAAMGAEPLWFLLSLTLPEGDAAWVEAFAEGMFQLADRAGIALVGGDMSRGPLSVAIQATGRVAPGAALRRGGARPGHCIAVTGVPGLGALGLRHWQAGHRDSAAARHFARPEPALAWPARLAGAGAAIDVSDGLLQDLGHILRASGGLGADIDLAALPGSAELDALSDEDRLGLQLSGGDDYVLLFTWPEARPLPTGAFAIGRVTEGGAVRLREQDGRWRSGELPAAGWRHF